MKVHETGFSCKRAAAPIARGTGFWPDSKRAGSQLCGTEAKMRGFCNVMPAFENVPVLASRSRQGSCTEPFRESLMESLSKRVSGRISQAGYASSCFPPSCTPGPVCGTGCSPRASAGFAGRGRRTMAMSADILGLCHCSGLSGIMPALPSSSNFSAQASSRAVSPLSCAGQVLSKTALSIIKDGTDSFVS